jgi:hypothetical protein
MYSHLSDTPHRLEYMRIRSPVLPVTGRRTFLDTAGRYGVTIIIEYEILINFAVYFEKKK